MSDSLQVKLEAHGIFIGSLFAVERVEKTLSKRGMAERIADAYADHTHPSYRTVIYWKQYPKAVLTIIVADCYAGEFNQPE